jgi:hypothetical protein
MALTFDPPTTAVTNPRLRLRRLDAPANALLLAGLWFGYAAVRNLTNETQHAALGNASRLLDAESALGIDIEGGLQSALDWPQAFVAANTYYLVHFPLTLTVMALAFWRRRTTVFPILRNSLIATTAVALVVHLLVPMAPPRMLPGFVDAGRAYGPDPYAIAGSESANQFAAMPSMHVAWAILAGYAIWHISGHRLVRALGALHPVITSLVVIVTGHHFVSDAAIGAALAFVFLAISRNVAIGRLRRSVGVPVRRGLRRARSARHLPVPGCSRTVAARVSIGVVSQRRSRCARHVDASGRQDRVVGVGMPHRRIARRRDGVVHVDLAATEFTGSARDVGCRHAAR